MTKELKPTYGNFTLRGQIVWKSRKNAFREDTGPSGYQYRALEFGVKTAEKNIVTVKLFQTKFNKVKLKNSETKKLDEEVNYGEHTGTLPDGYELFMPLHLGLSQDADGENIKEKLIQYDAIDYINKNLHDGDTVFMFGSPRFSEFTDKDKNVITQVEFEPRGIFKSTIGFEEEGFESESVFDQQLVIRQSEKKENKLIVDAFIITDKKGTFVPNRFFIDIDKYKDFALNVRKLKFGTVLSVEGFINHTVEEKEVETNDGWGESPSKNTITNVKRELEVTKAKKPKKEDIAFYKQEDFVKKENKPKKDEDNPFDKKDDNNSNGDWGNSPNSSDSDNGEFDNDDDPFA